MSKPTAKTGRLLLFVEDFTREPTGLDGMERLSLDLRVKNPLGSPGTVAWLPPAEVHDDQGRVFDAQPDDDWASPLEPGDEVVTHPLFEISVDAMDLTLVLGPGTEDEVEIELVPGA